jgi:uncharacterized membrane protein YkoI
MKTINRFFALALCGGSFVVAMHAEKVRFEELPLELRDKIRAQTGGSPVEDIDRQTRNGQTTYEVAFKKNGEHTELVFDQRGQLQNGPAGTLDSRKVTMQELPPVVQRVVEARLRGTTPNDIDRRVRDGEVTYEVGFKQGDRQHEIVVSQEGRIVSDAQSSVAATAVPARNVSPNPIQLSNKQKVTFDSLPAPVKQAVTAASKGARIEDAERGQWRARTIYEIAFKDQGRHIELQVEESGRVLHDPRLVTITSTGVPAAAATGAATSTLYRDVTSAVPLSSGQKVERASLPAAVERAITTHAANIKIEDVERGTWRGRNVYQVAFKDRGQHVELQIDENGNIVFDPRRK